MQIFDVIIFFKLRTIQQKTVKATHLCPLGARKLQKETGTRLKKLEKDDYIENLHVLSCFVLLKSVLLTSCVFWTKISGLKLLFFFSTCRTKHVSRKTAPLSARRRRSENGNEGTLIVPLSENSNEGT